MSETNWFGQLVRVLMQVVLDKYLIVIYTRLLFCQYVHNCLLFNYLLYKWFICVLSGVFAVSLTGKAPSVLTRAKRPRSDEYPFKMVFRTKRTGSPWTRFHYLYTSDVQNPIKRRSDALRAFEWRNRKYSSYWNQIHNPFHESRIRLIDFTYWLGLN